MVALTRPGRRPSSPLPPAPPAARGAPGTPATLLGPPPKPVGAVAGEGVGLSTRGPVGAPPRAARVAGGRGHDGGGASIEGKTRTGSGGPGAAGPVGSRGPGEAGRGGRGHVNTPARGNRRETTAAEGRVATQPRPAVGARASGADGPHRAPDPLRPGTGHANLGQGAQGPCAKKGGGGRGRGRGPRGEEGREPSVLSGLYRNRLHFGARPQTLRPLVAAIVPERQERGQGHVGNLLLGAQKGHDLPIPRITA